METNSQFYGNKLLVIGGTSGIGYRTAQSILEQKGEVIITGRNQTSVEQSIQKLSKFGKVYGIQVNITKEENLLNFFQKLITVTKISILS